MAQTSLLRQQPLANLIQRVSPTTWFALAAFCLLVLATGIYLSPEVTATLLLFFGIGTPLLLLLWSRPELGLLMVITITASILPLNLIDLRLPIGGGLKLRDIALLGMLALSGLQMMLHKRDLIPWRPVGTALSVFVGMAVFSALYAKLFQGVPTNWAFNDLRSIIFYTTFFITGWTVLKRKQLLVLLIGLLLVADLTAGIIIYQQFFGANTPLIASMTDVNWKVWENSDASSGLGSVRVIPPGHLLVYFMMLISTCLAIEVRQPLRLRLFSILQSIFLNLGLLLTFTRAQYVAVAIAFAVMFLILLPTYKRQFIRLLIIGVPILMVTLSLFGNKFGDLSQSRFFAALTDRFLSILTPGQTVKSDSLEWRVYETGEAIRSIREHPTLGVGLGNSYRDLTLVQGEVSGGWAGQTGEERTRFTRFVHNSYLYIAVKMGLPGLFIFVWFAICACIYAWKAYARAVDRVYRGIILAVLAGFLGLLQWSIFHVQLMQVESTVVIGLVVGLTGSVAYLAEQSRTTVNDGSYGRQ